MTLPMSQVGQYARLVLALGAHVKAMSRCYLVLVSLAATTAANGDSQADSLLNAYSAVPNFPNQYRIEWRSDIAIDASLPDYTANDIWKLPTDREMFDELIKDYAFSYALSLAKAVNLSSRLVVDRTRANFFIKSTDNIVGEVYENSPSGHLQRIIRTSSNGRNVCSLALEWRERGIRAATIEISVAADERYTRRCIFELVWRAFGFLGGDGGTGDWLDKSLTEQEKISLLKRRYNIN